MLEARQSLRRRWATCSWIVAPVAMSVGFCLMLLAFDRKPDRKLGIACDRVEERLLTTRDPVELERSRILASALHCGISRRISDWLSSRTGELVP